MSVKGQRRTQCTQLRAAVQQLLTVYRMSVRRRVPQIYHHGTDCCLYV